MTDQAQRPSRIRWRFLSWAGLFLGFPLAVLVVHALAIILHLPDAVRRRCEDLWEYYFHLPALAFGGAHFSGEKVCYIPADIVGLLQTTGLYLIIAACFTTAHVTIFKRKRK